MKERIKRIFGLFGLILAVLLVIFICMLFRGQSLAKRTYSLPSRSGRKLRILALADLHGKLPGEEQESFVQIVESANPDLIVYLGDMVDRSSPGESAAVLEMLTEKLIRIAPVCYVDGNHEQNVHSNYPDIYAHMNEALKEAGAVQLENEIIQLWINRDPEMPAQWISAYSHPEVQTDDSKGTLVNICGITTHYFWGMTEDSLTDELCSMDGINVMLCHYPESVIWYDAFNSGGLDLAICGHTHGGLIRFPLAGGMFAPEQGWWPKYDQGKFPIYTDTTWHEYGGADGSDYLGTMIISGGLAGEHGVPRINNPREISVIEIGYTD